MASSSDERKWCWSRHPEEPFIGHFDTRDEAIADIEDDAAEPCVGRVRGVRLADLYRADWLIETAQDNLWDIVGESADGWPIRRPTAETEAAFGQLINEWADRFDLQPCVFAVEDIEPVEVEHVD